MPTANAGEDKTVEVNQSLTITGTATDPDGTIASYEWKIGSTASAKEGSTVLATTASFSYTPTTVGTDTLTLTVADNDGDIATDHMEVVVTAVPDIAPPAPETPATPVAPSTTNVVISGKAFDDPIVGGLVTLKSLDTEESEEDLATTITNENGEFQFKINIKLIRSGYKLIITGGQMNGVPYTGRMTATYKNEDFAQANITPITTLIDSISVDMVSYSSLGKRNAAIQKLVQLGMISTSDWNKIESEYFNLGSIGFRIGDIGGITNWIELIINDIADGELSVREARSLFPKAHGGIEEIQTSLDRSLLLFPGETANVLFSVAPAIDGEVLIVRLVQAPDWVVLDGQQIKISPPIGTDAGESQITVEVTRDKDIAGRHLTISANVLKQVVLLSGSLGPSGGKIENEWRDIAVTAPANALLQTYEMVYTLGFDEQGQTRLSWKVTPEISKEEARQLEVIQPAISILKSRYADEQSNNINQRSLDVAARQAEVLNHRDSLPETPSGNVTDECLKDWKIHGRDGKKRGIFSDIFFKADGFQFSHVWQSTTGKFSEQEPGLSSLGFLSRPRILPSRTSVFSYETSYDCASMLLSEHNLTIGPRDLEPVLLVNGYAQGLMGEIDAYFGSFPKLLKAQGYTPFIFSWHTNSRFEDSANELGDAIRKINDITGKKVHIVAHSFGGVLTRTLLQGLAEKKVGSNMVKTGEFNQSFMESRIASVITLGTPHSGIFGENETIVEFDNKGPITFYYGRDDLAGVATENGSSLTTHEAGEDYWRLGGTGSLLDKEDDFGVAGDPGHVVYNLAKSFSEKYPKIRTKVLIGYKPDGVSCVQDASSMEDLQRCEILYSVEKHTGDGLISLQGQRLLPSLSDGGLLYSSLYDHSIPVDEHLLGFGMDDFKVGKFDHLLPIMYSAMNKDTFYRDGYFKPGIILDKSDMNDYSSVIYHHRSSKADLTNSIRKFYDPVWNPTSIPFWRKYRAPIVSQAALQDCGELSELVENADNKPSDYCNHATWKYLTYMVDTYPSEQVDPQPKINARGKIIYKDANDVVQTVTDPTEVQIYIGSTMFASSQTDNDGNFSFDVEFRSEETYELRVIPPASAQSRGVEVWRVVAKTLEDSSLDFSQIELFSKVWSLGQLTVQLKDSTTGSTLTGYSLTIKGAGFPPYIYFSKKKINDFGDAVFNLPLGIYLIEITKPGYVDVLDYCYSLRIGNVCDITSTKKDPNITNGLVAHYQFEDNAQDSSGDGNHGTETGSVDYSTGVDGQALTLNGDGYINLGDKFDTFNEISITSWVKFNQECMGNN